MPEDNKQVPRREFFRVGARGVALAAVVGGTGYLATRSREARYVWQLDPSKCTQCGKCATNCVLKPSAVKCVHAFAMCGYCELCTGYFEPEPNALTTAAPGYRQDAAGNLWIPYPARVDAGPLGKWLPTYQHDQAMCYCDETLAIAGTDTPWVFTSGYCHDKPLRFRLLDAGQPPASYTVKLYFAEPEDAKPGDRAFAVRLQGKEVLKGLDIVAEAGGHRRALVKEFRGVEVKDYLDIALAPAGGSRLKQPILSGFQAVLEAR